MSVSKSFNETTNLCSISLAILRYKVCHQSLSVKICSKSFRSCKMCAIWKNPSTLFIWEFQAETGIPYHADTGSRLCIRTNFSVVSREAERDSFISNCTDWSPLPIKQNLKMRNFQFLVKVSYGRTTVQVELSNLIREWPTTPSTGRGLTKKYLARA